MIMDVIQVAVLLVTMIRFDAFDSYCDGKISLEWEFYHRFNESLS